MLIEFDTIPFKASEPALFPRFALMLELIAVAVKNTQGTL